MAFRLRTSATSCPCIPLWKALNKNLSLSEPLKNAAPISEKRDVIEIEEGRFLLDQNFLSLDSSRIRLCEAPCGAGVAFFRGFFGKTGHCRKFAWR
jgi:hypothetical protein